MARIGVSLDDLSSSALFAAVAPPTLRECADRAQSVTFPRGTVLARQGEPADAFYLLLDGSVEVVIERSGEPDELIDVLGRGDPVGDLALLLSEERTATVRALRDCRVAQLTATDFDWLLHASADFTLELARMVAKRLHRTTHRVGQVRPVDTVAAVASSARVDLDGFCRSLEGALAEESRRADRPSSCTVIAVPADTPAGAQMARALRDADVVLFLGAVGDPPGRGRLTELLDVLADLRPYPRLDLVLLQSSSPPYRGTGAWLGDDRVSSWHHIRPNRSEDYARLARWLAGTAVGLVLSGGGARGFAHIGVLRAFRDQQVPVDFVAGASMGAIVAAQHAMGLDPPAIVELMRGSYVSDRGRPDFTIPYVAVRSGAATNTVLKRLFGDTLIEDLPIPFFCVSSNLVDATTVVHARGRLWQAVRSSCSIPGLVPPVRFADDLLVDGGLLDNLPVAAMRERCRGRVVASDVSVAVDPLMHPSAVRRRPRLGRFGPPPRMPGIGPILMRTVELASVRDAREAGIPADLYLEPPVDHVGMSDFERLDESVALGYEHACEELAGWTR